VAGQVLGNDPLSLWMAYMPGAIEAIAIVAFSGGLNVVFILSHHLVRMVVLHFAPTLIVLARKRSQLINSISKTARLRYTTG
jgi:uncharacterized membrane protein AbrB (regulator of aidB expression)